MVATFSDNKKIYSVDLMIAYVNIFKPQSVKINIKDYLETNVNFECWGNPTKNIKYSPRDVINNPKKYKEDYQRIMDANLKYPIFITENGIIIDGVHRIVKAAYLKKKQINAYVFDKKFLNKFLLDRNRNFEKVNKLTQYDLILLFNKRFKGCK